MSFVQIPEGDSPTYISEPSTMWRYDGQGQAWFVEVSESTACVIDEDGDMLFSFSREAGDVATIVGICSRVWTMAHRDGVTLGKLALRGQINALLNPPPH